MSSNDKPKPTPKPTPPVRKEGAPIREAPGKVVSPKPWPKPPKKD